MHTEKLLAAAREGGDLEEIMNLFEFDPKVIDWEDYFMNIHIPGIIKYVSRETFIANRTQNIWTLIVMFSKISSSMWYGQQKKKLNVVFYQILDDFTKALAIGLRTNKLRFLNFRTKLSVILSHLASDGPREIGRLAYRFQAVTPDDRLEYRPSWLSEDRHVWITFEVHRRIMQDRLMEFLAEVRHVGGSSGFRPYKLPAAPAPVNIVPLDYNSDEDSDYDDESSGHSTDEDEMVPNTPAAGGPRLMFPAPKPIPALTDVPSFFKQLDIDVRHVEDPSMESVAVEYNTDGGVEFTVGHRMLN
ncbi:hypothetical protein PIB30_008219 [Stylosanthes scabra]|uniref:Uncharacterized protein n=1 Tax=Stylosanthes scabra TaxID=79078 RepID=A0ABU6Q4U3_9FABA|nr:hypothetical protein [Stylosanthes scabra]